MSSTNTTHAKSSEEIAKEGKESKEAEKYKADFDQFFLKDTNVKPPQVNFDSCLLGGKIEKWTGKMADVYSPIYHTGSSSGKIKLGSAAMMSEEKCLEALDAAVKSWNNGQGEWALMKAEKRIEAVSKYLEGLKKKRTEIVDLLMWEICKNKSSAAKEFDRTVEYVDNTVKDLKKMENESSSILNVEGSIAQIRRAPVGVVLCCGPYNYPFNELYCTLFPALLMGNSVIMKTARNGVLIHAPTLELFKDCFPAGVINIISGSGRETLPPIMKTGKVDIFTFIGTSSAADAVQKAHPYPHRLKICFGLEAKNPALILPDADLSIAVKECVLGSLSYNGQRCTALKIIWVHESLEKEFISKYSAAVDALKMGMPWDEGVEITPLPEPEKPEFLAKLISDAIGKGAKIVNSRHGIDRSFVAPFVLANVKKNMRIYTEEQFGPVIPIVTYSKIEDIYAYVSESNYGQQASVFSTGKNLEDLGKLIDVLINQVCRVNLNTQCQRGPDMLPFTGRKDSAHGTLSVYDALRVFSVRACVTTSTNSTNTSLVSKIMSSGTSKFLRMDYIF